MLPLCTDKIINPGTYSPRYANVWDSGDAAPCIFNPNAGWRLLVTFIFLVIYARGKSPRPDLLGWVQFTAGLDGRFEGKSLLPPWELCINQD
jgi:hypothetical protein